ncbi:hypothetical protein FACS1894184_08790 [Clostridia bacterium]|nr:hypothetical protein FACS1894184_08790 [Clostridia bacterium]
MKRRIYAITLLLAVIMAAITCGLIALFISGTKDAPLFDSPSGWIGPMVCVTLTALIAAAIVTNWLTRRIVKPLNNLDLDALAERPMYDELAPLLNHIHELKRQTKRQMEALDRQRNEFTNITDHMDEGFLILNRTGRVLSYNKSALKLLGAADVDPVGQSILTLNRSEGLRRVVQNVLRGGSAEMAGGIGAGEENLTVVRNFASVRNSTSTRNSTGSQNSYEKTPNIIQMNGRAIHALVSPVQENREIKGLVLILLDVTERQEREQLRREFTANVSHELKTPLTTISGYAELLMTGFAKPEDIPGFAGHIHRETMRLVALINDLLFLSHLDEAAPAKQSDVDMLAVCRSIASSLTYAAQKRSVSITVGGEQAFVRGVPTVLEAIVLNLADNAVKYNREGGSVEIDVHNEAEYVVLTVTDTGIGIPKPERERVFERFYRVDKSRNGAVPGTGLGLAIVKHGLALHNAAMELDSGLSGTRVTVRFPV